MQLMQAESAFLPVADPSKKTRPNGKVNSRTGILMKFLGGFCTEFAPLAGYNFLKGNKYRSMGQRPHITSEQEFLPSTARLASAPQALG